MMLEIMFNDTYELNYHFIKPLFRISTQHRVRKKTIIGLDNNLHKLIWKKKT